MISFENDVERLNDCMKLDCLDGSFGNVSRFSISFDYSSSKFEEGVCLELDLHCRARLNGKLEDVLVKIQCVGVSGLMLGDRNTDYYETELSSIEHLQVSDIRKDQITGMRFSFDGHESTIRFMCHSFSVEVEAFKHTLGQ